MTYEFIAIIITSLILLCAGMWIPFVISFAAFFIIFAKQGLTGLKAIGIVTWGSMNSFTLTAIPLFILMAEILLRSGLATRLYKGLSHALRNLPGGLLQTNIIGCALFSAMSGSSVATAAAIGTVALPNLEARGYSMRMSYGTLAAGGTLGILIPPSIAMIIYGTFSETSIVRLFMAGVIPGVILTAFFVAFVMVVALLNPNLAPTATQDEKYSTRQIAADILPVTLLVILVLGSLYLGLATPTEAAAVGSIIAMLIARIWGNFNFEIIRGCFHKTVRVSTAILFIVLGAFLFSYAVAITGVSRHLAQYVMDLELSKPVFIITSAILYLVLGLFIESIAMMVITVPLMLPLLTHYGIDPIWFGVFLVILIEIGQITPPFGLNLFVIQSIRKGKLEEIIIGALPYYILMVIFLILLYMIPSIALWLPSLV